MPVIYLLGLLTERCVVPLEAETQVPEEVRPLFATEAVSGFLARLIPANAVWDVEDSLGFRHGRQLMSPELSPKRLPAQR